LKLDLKIELVIKAEVRGISTKENKIAMKTLNHTKYVLNA